MNARYKYPRTFHLPFSQGCTSDDKKLENVDCFIDQQIVVTEKMDGENTTLYSDGLHARSIDSKRHVSQDWVAKLQSEIGYKIPIGWRVCGENLYAVHSIAYNNLSSYFLAFSVWDENNICLDWDTTKLLLNELSLETPKVLYQGIYSDKVLKDLVSNLNTSTQEGFVVRITNSFVYDNFSKSVAKYVRPNHVTTDKHWKHQKITVNNLHNKHGDYLS
jgi:ATP-dependent RNA circularization protein (DNA/RNA ligase family)